MTVAVDLITGLLSALAFDVAKMPYRSLVQSIESRKQIDHALGTRQSGGQNKALKNDKAFEELIRVIAHSTGNYTDDVAIFLSELSKSAVPDAMRDFIVAGKSPDPAFPMFDSIYRAAPTLPFESQTLFDALAAAIRSRFHSSVKDTGLLEAIEQHSQRFDEQFENLKGALQRSLPRDHVFTLAEFSAARSRIAGAIEEANSKISVETTEGQKHVDITKIVINARLGATDPRNPVTPTISGHYDKGLTVQDFRRTVHRAVILGDPGGGKSTLTQNLCYSMAHQIGIDAKAPYHIEINPQDLKLPLKIVLRTLEKRQSKTPHYDVLDYLEDDLRLYFSNDIASTRSFVAQLLSQGGAFVLFDGLDEILDVSVRRQMAQQIDGFCQFYAACPVIVTSRVVGYREAPLGRDFSAYVLSRFNRGEVLSFATNMMREVKHLQDEDAEALANNFVSQTETTANDLRQNPLMLGLMVFLFMYKGDVPDNRPEIYKECTLLMFQKWDKNRGINVGLSSDFKLLDLFGFLASKIFGSAENEEGVDSHWLQETVFEFFQNWYSSRSEAQSATSQLVEFITGRAWIMCAAGPGTFKFTHRTFLEFFFARRIESESVSVEDLINNRLMAYIVRSEWDVVNHLALQIATFERGPQALMAHRVLLDALSSTRDEDELSRLLLFVSRSLEYLLVPEPSLREAISTIYAKAIALTQRAGTTLERVLEILVYYTKKREHFVEETLSTLVQDSLSSSVTTRRKTVYLLGFRQRESPARRMRLGQDPVDFGLVWSALTRVRHTLRGGFWRAALSSRDGALDYMYIYGDKYDELFSCHGMSLLDGRTTGAPPTYQLPGVQIVNRAVIVFSNNRSRSAISNSDEVAMAHLFVSSINEGEEQPEFVSSLSKNVIRFARSELDHTIGLVYDIVLSRRHTSKTLDDLAAVFALMIWHADAIDRSNPRTKRWTTRQRLLRYAPDNALTSLISRFSGTRASPILESWLNSSSQPRKRD